MKKKELVERMKALVSDVADIDLCMLESSRRQNCVEARIILVKVLLDRGLHESETAGFLGVTRQAVNKLKNSFSFRIKDWSFRQLYEEVRKAADYP